MGAMRALIAEILGLSDEKMMKIKVPNGQVFQFDGELDVTGSWHFEEVKVPSHLLSPDQERVTEPTAPAAKATSQPNAALTRGGPGRRK
jgi:hypothetical protein